MVQPTLKSWHPEYANYRISAEQSMKQYQYEAK